MSTKHTPGPTYVVERNISVGYRGGKRKNGWKVVRASDGRLMRWYQWQDSAKDGAALLNSLECPMTEAPEHESDYWRLTESGHWLYTWTGSAEDLQALRDGKAFSAIAKATGSAQ